MKTPQEIRDEFDRILVRVHARDEHAASTVFHDALAAAREEGRREGIGEGFQSALDYHADTCAECGGQDDGCEFGQWLELRALASQPKPVPAVTCEGCKAGLPIEVRHIEKISNWVGKADLYTPCTAKPEGGKEPGT